ncbi:prolyl oligopeptidase family serine peptidase [Clostridium phoceensis]|uniref:carboxylesterase family protein n=1 Tax=Clostridium phoceensis TaxID=1650661 RepID=UPI00097CF533|nr:prolyl oligopeptidase family serine peptidase [Clostridium phoceensis]
MRKVLAALLSAAFLLSGCTAQAAAKRDDTAAAARQSAEKAAVQGGFVENQTLDGADGTIHFSYYLPDGYDSDKTYPLIVTMPGYDRMWFGEDSAGSNLTWNGVQAWTKLGEPVILVSGQLTDWGAKSARQANELAEYMIAHFSVDRSRIYAAGYSAGGETMSQAVALRPDLYAAYLHGGSQWDGTYDPIAENRIAVYIFMAENDEYYGSQKARDAYQNLHAAYEKAGLRDSEIDRLLQLNIPDNAWFNAKGIYNYHGGGSVVFDDETVLDWVLSQKKSTGKDETHEKDETISDGDHGGGAGDRGDPDSPGGRGCL